MKVNSAKSFRKWVKETEHRKEVDENFMGYGYDEKNIHTHGFFNLYHGIKNDIEGYLRPRLDLAQDNQTIYEFVQNAADCKATNFYSFWNDEYFLVCNNGEKFNREGLKSILNEGQSTKHNPESIGRYGVGFKIIHRLVGEQNGLNEIMNHYCGPIIFSWETKEDILSFIRKETISYLEYDDKAPFLLKILLTNFPSDVEEKVYDTSHEERIVFGRKELEKCQEYVLQCLGETIESNISEFTQGSIFFLRLGKGKKSYLDDNYKDFSEGLSYSMNTLKRLSTICINDEYITKQNLCLEKSSITVKTDIFDKLTIDSNYKDYDVQYAFGYIPYADVDELTQLERLKASPNFYKFFPIGDEINNFAIFIHCDTFSISSSRRSLDNSDHNKIILGEIAKFIISTLEEYKQSHYEKYLQLFVAILLSEQPNAQNNKWMDSIFYQPLFEYIKQNTPTKINTFLTNDKVKIKNTSLPINPHEIGADYDWFIYDNDKDSSIQKSACTKLNIATKDAKSLIKDGSTEKWNIWLTENRNLLDTLLNELERAEKAMDFSYKLKELKFFTINSEYYSYKEITTNNNFILLSDNTAPIKDILEKLGFQCTNETFNESHPLWKHLEKQNEQHLFKLISEKLRNETSLSKEEKIRLVKAKFDQVGDETKKQITIFHNQNGVLTPTQWMLPYSETLPSWLSNYVINKNEYSADLDKYLIPAENAFSNIVKIFYSTILPGISNNQEVAFNTLFDTFKEKWTDDFTEILINFYKGSLDLIPIIEASHSKQESFLRKIQSVKLDANIDYFPDSKEYRLLRLSTFSETNAEILRGKILIGDKTLNQYAVTDTITINKFRNKQIADIVMSVSEILPQKVLLGEFSKIALKFPEFQSLFAKKEMAIYDVFNQIPKNSTGYYSNPQRAFFMLYSGYYNTSSITPNINFCDINDYLSFVEYLYHKGNIWHEIIKEYCKPFSNNANGKIYVFAHTYTLDSERADSAIEQWIGSDEDKLNFIKLFGYKDITSDELKRRKKFNNNEEQIYSIVDFQTNKAFLDWVSTLQLPFIEKNQISVLQAICKQSPNLIKENLDSEILEKESIEWDDAEYKKWSEEKRIKILQFDGEIPYNGQHNNTTLYKIGSEDYCHYNNSIYINRNKDTNSLLAIVADDNKIPWFTSDDWNKIFKTTDGLILSQAKELQELKNKYEQLRRSYDELINQGKETERGNKDSKSQQEDSRQYCEFACNRLEELGYNCSYWRNDSYAPDSRVITPNNETINVVCRGIGYNKLHLSAKSFQHLLSSPKNMLIIVKDKKIHTIEFGGLFTMTSDVNMLFKVANTPIHYFMALTKIFENIPGSSFVIDNPNYSAADELKGFGLEIRNDGEIAIADENMLPE